MRLIHKGDGNTGWKGQLVSNAAQGTLKNLKSEIESGLIKNFRLEVAADVLTDFLQLARTALDQNTEGAKNVAAVLAAAAFEDTIRRLGSSIGVVAQEGLADVLHKLKDAGVIQSPQVGIAQSYLSFRNHALHANWDKVERASIQSVLGFVEQLLIKHFQ